MISLFVGQERATQRQKLNDPLSVLGQHIDFAGIAAAVDAKLALGPSGRGGRPPYPTALMVKLLLLQQLYNLSDEALEFQVLDRASFQTFLGLEHHGRVPDAKTIWVWRERLKQDDLIGDISAAISDQRSAAAGRIHCARRPDHRREHRQCADPAQPQPGERGDQARSGAEGLERVQARAEGHRCAVDEEAWQELLRIQGAREHGSALGLRARPHGDAGQRARQPAVRCGARSGQHVAHDSRRQCLCQRRARSRAQAARLSRGHPAQGHGRQAAERCPAASQSSDCERSRVRRAP
ncbi:MAG: transposase, partial [Proteobacteria bacterium]|nr:transposase [Pseudomonadota bacterium]